MIGTLLLMTQVLITKPMLICKKWGLLTSKKLIFCKNLHWRNYSNWNKHSQNWFKPLDFSIYCKSALHPILHMTAIALSLYHKEGLVVVCEIWKTSWFREICAIVYYAILNTAIQLLLIAATYLECYSVETVFAKHALWSKSKKLVSQTDTKTLQPVR